MINHWSLRENWPSFYKIVLILWHRVLFCRIPFPSTNCRQRIHRLLSNIAFYTLKRVICNGNNINNWSLREIWDHNLQNRVNFVVKICSIWYIKIPFNYNWRQSPPRLLSNITFYTLIRVICNGRSINDWSLREIWDYFPEIELIMW